MCRQVLAVEPLDEVKLAPLSVRGRALALEFLGELSILARKNSFVGGKGEKMLGYSQIDSARRPRAGR
jgi:hypothetical protein